MFTLHSRLATDTYVLGRLPLSLVLLAKDANYPWCILVPQREGVREIHQLSLVDRHQLLDESCALAEVMEEAFQSIKMNVAALGNMVPQLHLHHIARFEDDNAWPKPIWGEVAPLKYKGGELQGRSELLQQGLSNAGVKFEIEANLNLK
jgi:diadenosine tetraphosphate (Ap4A) HIT family hydrolase